MEQKPYVHLDTDTACQGSRKRFHLESHSSVNLPVYTNFWYFRSLSLQIWEQRSSFLPCFVHYLFFFQQQAGQARDWLCGCIYSLASTMRPPRQLLSPAVLIESQSFKCSNTEHHQLRQRQGHDPEVLQQQPLPTPPFHSHCCSAQLGPLERWGNCHVSSCSQ